MRSPIFRSLLLPALVAVWVLASAAPAAADPTEAAVTVVHAVPGLTVDVYVNGDLTLPSFKPRTITQALPLPAGTYDIVIVPEGGDPSLPAITGSATVAGGDRVTLVAHLAADGTPILTPFGDDLTLAERGRGRLIVRHVAAAPAVDVRLSRRSWRRSRTIDVLKDLSNGEQAQTDVRARHYQATLLAAGTSTVAFGPANVRAQPGRATIVYAFGDLAGDSFDLLVEQRALRSEKANVTVVHGVPGLTVDVYLDGVLALPSFQPKTITDVIQVPCGKHDIVIVPEGGDPASPALSATVDLGAGSDTSLVAHLDANGAPTLSSFENDLSYLGLGSRLVARHTAAAPAVDLRVAHRRFWWCKHWIAVVLEDLENGEQADSVVWPGRYLAYVTPAGNPDITVLGPAPLRLRSGKVTFVYAIGSLADDSLDLLVHVRSRR